jgi:catechol 2,3-dioxygenase-like lactoylglutathione lyase family enzyme
MWLKINNRASIVNHLVEKLGAPVTSLVGDTVTSMFDRVTIRAADRVGSERFYRTVLSTLGIEPTHVGAETIEWDDFAIVAADADPPPTQHLHLAFVAPSPEHVDKFWHAGVDAGYEDDGEPGPRAQYTPDYYGAFLRDPDGNSAEAVHHADVRRGGNLDHLWIRVLDLDAATAFYATVARHTGLREGRRWEGGQQFRGAWATFSLVQDGTPPTENLHVAFPAPDRRTVEDFHRAATAAGYRDSEVAGGPSQIRSGYYAAHVLDPDGTNVGSVFHERS